MVFEKHRVCLSTLTSSTFVAFVYPNVEGESVEGDRRATRIDTRRQPLEKVRIARCETAWEPKIGKRKTGFPLSIALSGAKLSRVTIRRARMCASTSFLTPDSALRFTLCTLGSCEFTSILIGLDMICFYISKSLIETSIYICNCVKRPFDFFSYCYI